MNDKSSFAPVRALIFDFGGVITRTLFETHDMSERALGLAPGTLNWRGPFDPDTDQLWQDMQAGKISERDYWRIRTMEVGALVGEHWTEMAQFVRAARGADPLAVIRPHFLSTMNDAREAGLKLAILSNELDLFYGADFRERLPFLQFFDTIHDATHTEILKPDARAYEAVLNDLALNAGECLFIDDQQRNIDGGLAVGLQCVRFDVTHPTHSYAEIRRRAGLAVKEEEET